MTGKRDIEITRGEDYSHVVTVVEETSPGVWAAVNITGRSYAAELKRVKTQVVPDATFTYVLTDPTNGEFTLYLGSGDTADLTADCYKWDVWQDASGVLNPLFGGEAKVVTGVTEP